MSAARTSGQQLLFGDRKPLGLRLAQIFARVSSAASSLNTILASALRPIMRSSMP
jgi:hypothetical protein